MKKIIDRYCEKINYCSTQHTISMTICFYCSYSTTITIMNINSSTVYLLLLFSPDDRWSVHLKCWEKIMLHSNTKTNTHTPNSFLKFGDAFLHMFRKWNISPKNIWDIIFHLSGHSFEQVSSEIHVKHNFSVNCFRMSCRP